MGRYYWGNIEGKFWFGVQCSSDISNILNIEYITNYIWKVCYCNVENTEDVYCSQCFPNYEVHESLAIEEGYDNEELFLEDNTISYEINKEVHYDELIEALDKLKKHLPDFLIEEINNIVYDDKILNTAHGTFEKVFLKYDEHAKSIPFETNIFLARYLLGLQIKYCLEKQNFCHIYCEC